MRAVNLCMSKIVDGIICSSIYLEGLTGTHRKSTHAIEGQDETSTLGDMSNQTGGEGALAGGYQEVFHGLTLGGRCLPATLSLGLPEDSCHRDHQRHCRYHGS